MTDTTGRSIRAGIQQLNAPLSVAATVQAEVDRYRAEADEAMARADAARAGQGPAADQIHGTKRSIRAKAGMVVTQHINEKN